MIYVEPALFQQALGGKPLPFIEGGLSNDPRLFAATESLLLHRSIAPLDPLEQDDAILRSGHRARRREQARRTTIAHRWTTARRSGPASICMIRSIGQSRWTNWRRPAGRDRWSLSRDFRALFGTSPHRYLTMRRLDRVRRLAVQGRVARGRIGGCRLHRSEPYDAALQARVGRCAGALAEDASGPSTRGSAPQADRPSSRTPSLTDLGRRAHEYVQDPIAPSAATLVA